MAIRYNVPVPRLDGLTEAQRNRALEDYMRESNRQMEIILTQIQEEMRNGRRDQTKADA